MKGEWSASVFGETRRHDLTCRTTSWPDTLYLLVSTLSPTTPGYDVLVALISKSTPELF